MTASVGVHCPEEFPSFTWAWEPLRRPIRQQALDNQLVRYPLLELPSNASRILFLLVQILRKLRSGSGSGHCSEFGALGPGLDPLTA